MQSRQKRLCARGLFFAALLCADAEKRYSASRGVNCGLVWRLCPPDAVPAEAFVRAGLFCAALLCADAKKRYSASRGVNCGLAWRLCPPDIVSAEAFVRAGVVLRGDVVLLRRSAFDHVCCTFLSECFAFGSCLICGSIAAPYVRFTPAIRFYWEVLRSAHACLFSFVRKRETACDMFRSCSAVGRDRHSCVLGCRAVIGLCRFISGLHVSLWRSRRRTKERGERSRRRGKVRFCVIVLALRCFPRGVRWGYAPQTAPKSLRLSGLSSFDSRCGCVSRGEGLECITETCPAPISGGRTAAGRAGRVMLRGSKWKPHSGLSGLSSFDSRRGCVSRGEGHSGTTEL